ncbi:MAG: MgtC/SapB family protein [archaeon]
MPADQLAAAPLDSQVVRLALAAALGLFLGLEREWSHKAAGIRTFALISLTAAVFTVIGRETLLVIGGALVIALAVLLAVEGLLNQEEGLSLTTSVSMLVAYGVGALVADGYIIEGVTVAVLSSLLLVFKRELHSIAWGLSREELRSTAEFAIVAFVIYPLLPAEPVPATPVSIGEASVDVSVEPRVVWLMVVTVAAIGIVNYVIVRNYDSRGIAVTGFVGGLASSTAVVGTMLDHVRQNPDASAYAVAAILLADAAMALRNLVIAIGFTLTADRPPLLAAAAPLGLVIVGAVVLAAATGEWRESVEMDLESPFSLRNALGFGAVFAVIVVVAAVADAQFGVAGLYLTAVVSGLVSSAGVTASAVSLYRTGAIGSTAAVSAILIATASSIAIKAALTGLGPDRTFAKRVTVYSTGLLVAAGVLAVVLSI